MTVIVVLFQEAHVFGGSHERRDGDRRDRAHR